MAEVSLEAPVIRSGAQGVPEYLLAAPAVTNFPNPPRHALLTGTGLKVASTVADLMQ